MHAPKWQKRWAEREKRRSVERFAWNLLKADQMAAACSRPQETEREEEHEEMETEGATQTSSQE